jgi:NAD(P)-dependent dehydrogenase (short-subunit alcohol dehydrogenase family)
MLLEGKVIIITGSARGIGRVFAKGIAAMGGKVVVSDVLDGELVAEEIRTTGGNAVFIRADVSMGQDTEALAKATHDMFGQIDGLVNNAAVHAELEYIPFDQIDEKEWDRVFAVNVKGSWLMTRAVYPFMKLRGVGKIVNIGSGTPFKGAPKMYHYVVSKGAIMTLTRVMARTLGKDGICVNCISPSLTRSDSVVEIRGEKMMQQEEAALISNRAIPRSEVPEDLVGALAFFLSDGANFITGQNLPVNGGDHML